MDVLITGAFGPVGTAITDYLDGEHDITVLDIEAEETDHERVVADVRNYDEIRTHFEDQDAVIHLVKMPGIGGPSSRELGWTDGLRDNLESINNVYEATVDAGCSKLIFASSNHTVGLFELEHAPDVYYDQGITVGHDEPHRPDSRYGLTKCYGEDLGRLAAEAHGVQFYALRIGNVRRPEHDHPFGFAELGVERGMWERGSEEYEEQVARMRAVWLSRRDMGHLVQCCLADESVEWDHFYGVSANDRRWLDDLEYARKTIGYEPRDDGEEWDSPPG